MMGERIGVSKSTLNSWVRGLALPPEHKLHRISVLTNKPLNGFCGVKKPSLTIVPSVELKLNSNVVFPAGLLSITN